MHGGKSTGPRTAAGLKRSQEARLKHGRFSRAAKEHRAKGRALERELKEIMRILKVNGL